LPEDRIAVFDQDGTLWVEHPMYTQVVYCLERFPAVVAKKPELKNVEPFFRPCPRACLLATSSGGRKCVPARRAMLSFR
jgi:hypothetical protein